jgi:hypothetical protein
MHEASPLEAASLEDIVPMLGLADDIKVSEIMTTQNSLACYVY